MPGPVVHLRHVSSGRYDVWCGDRHIRILAAEPGLSKVVEYFRNGSHKTLIPALGSAHALAYAVMKVQGIEPFKDWKLGQDPTS